MQHWAFTIWFAWVPRIGRGAPCSEGGDASAWVVEVPFAEAARWAGALRRLRFVAQNSGMALHGEKAKGIAGEIGFKDWSGTDLSMAEPILYGLRNAVLALEGCEDGRTAGACPSADVGMRLLEKLLRFDRHVVESYDYYRQKVRERPLIPITWQDAVLVLVPGGEVERALRGLGATRVELESSDLNGVPSTCDVRLPPADGAPSRDPGVALRDGLGLLPLLGFGTSDSFWEVPGITDLDDAPSQTFPNPENVSAVKLNREACVRAVSWALEAGYQYLDTAQEYDTQICIGKALASRGVARADVWVATKLSYESDFWRKGARVRPAFDQQLAELQMESVDVYLQHHSSDGGSQMQDVWLAMEALVREGLVRVLGGSSHGCDALTLLESSAKKGTKPAVVYQKWDVYHRGAEERTLRRLANKTGMRLFGTGAIHGTPFELSCASDPIVRSIATKVSRTPAQVCVRFVLQNGLGVLVKSRRRSRIFENAQVFDFDLSDPHMQVLNSLAYAVRPGWGDLPAVQDCLGYSRIHQYAREEL